LRQGTDHEHRADLFMKAVLHGGQTVHLRLVNVRGTSVS
jgi:hypothetical protein